MAPTSATSTPMVSTSGASRSKATSGRSTPATRTSDPRPRCRSPRTLGVNGVASQVRVAPRATSSPARSSGSSARSRSCPRRRAGRGRRRRRQSAERLSPRRRQWRFRRFRFAGIGSIHADEIIGGSSGATTFDPDTGILFTSGAILAEGKIGKLTVSNDLEGNDDALSGSVVSRTGFGQVTIGTTAHPGGLMGGMGGGSGAVIAGSLDIANNPPVAGRIGPVLLKGSLSGGVVAIFPAPSMQMADSRACRSPARPPAMGSVVASSTPPAASLPSKSPAISVAISWRAAMSGPSTSAAPSALASSMAPEGDLHRQGRSDPSPVGKLDANPGDRGFIQVRGLLDQHGSATSRVSPLARSL